MNVPENLRSVSVSLFYVQKLTTAEVAKMMLQDYSKTQVMPALWLALAERCFLNPQ